MDWKENERISMELTTGMQIRHNYIRPHKELNGDTQTDMTRIRILVDSKWKTIIQVTAMSTD